MKKTVCDICGNDASEQTYVVPFANTHYAEKDGVRIAAFDRIDLCEFNLCHCHRVQLANTLKAWCNACKQVEIHEM